jgi:hypothetical protein
MELLGRGAMIFFPLIMLKGLFLKTFGKYVVHALPVIDLGIALGFLLMAGGAGIIIWKIIRDRMQRP